MGMFGGIIAGAMGGAGQAGVQSLNTQQQQQGNLYNAEQLAQMNSDLEVHKNIAIMQAQQNMRLAALGAPPGAQSSPAPNQSPPASQPAAASAPAPAPSNAPATSTATAAPSGLDISKMDPVVAARLAKMDPVAFSNGVQDFQKTNAPAIATPPVNYSLPTNTATASAGAGAASAPIAHAYQFNQATGVLEPTYELKKQALQAETTSPGGAAEVYKTNAPSGFALSMASQGKDPYSQEGMAAEAAYIAAHNSKENSQVMRPGGMVMENGKLISSTPDANGIYYTQNDDGSLQPHTAPGYGALKGATAGAIAAGELSGKNSVTLAPPDARPVDSDGRQIPITTAAAIANGAAGQGAGLSPGQQATNAANASAALENQKLPTLAATALSTRTTYENALQIAQQLAEQNKATGPGVVPQAQLWSKLANVFPELGTKPSDYANNIQLLSKLLNNAQSSAESAVGANRSDASAEQFGKGQANADTLNIQPLIKAIKYNLSLQDAIPAKSKFIADTATQYANTGHPAPDLSAQQAWSNIYNPRVFEINRLDPAEQVATINNMTPADAKKYIDQKAAMKKAGVFP